MWKGNENEIIVLLGRYIMIT